MFVRLGQDSNKKLKNSKHKVTNSFACLLWIKNVFRMNESSFQIQKKVKMLPVEQTSYK